MPPLNTFTRSCLALAIGQAVVAPAQAANIVVNDTGDTERVDELCTLREAIESINEAGLRPGCANSGAAFGINDTITFNSDVLAAGTIYRTQTALLFITEDLTIEGPASGTITIDGLGKAGIFDINGSAVTMSNLLITGGNTAGNGGGIRAQNNSTLNLANLNVAGNTSANRGGGIFVVTSSLHLANSTVSGNSATSGAGIFVDYGSSLDLLESVITQNSSVRGEAFLGGRGGGIYSKGTANISNSSVTENQARLPGGGIFSLNTLSLSNSFVTYNRSLQDGGGIYARGQVSLIDTTVSENNASEGGGISHGGVHSLSLQRSTVSGNTGGGIFETGSLILTNSTVSGNVTKFLGGNGGGLNFYGANARISNSTITDNSASNRGGGVFVDLLADVYLDDTIIAGNMAASNAELAINNEMPAFAGSVAANNNNLFGDNSQTNYQALGSFSPGPADFNATINGDGVSAHIPTALSSILEPLADNGGSTRTHALPVASPAINRGNNAGCPATDQRGRKRNDGKCDIGAYEFKDESSFFVVPLPNGKTVIFGL